MSKFLDRPMLASHTMEEVQYFGIDTIKLRILEYKLSPSSDLELKQSSVNIKTGEKKDILLYNANGLKLEGQKAYKNADNYNLTLTDYGLFLQCSIPKVANGNNNIPVDLSLTRKALQTVQEDLQRNDIKVSLESASLSRLDLFRQQKTVGNFLDYVPVFGLLPGLRMKRRNYGSTFLYNNTKREVCFYDKDQENAFKEGRKSDVSSNNIRAEVRLLKHKAIEDTGYNLLTDIFKNYEGLQDVYREQIKAVIKDFSQVGGTYLIQSDLLKEARQLKEYNNGKFGRKEFRELILNRCVSNILEETSSESLLQTVLQVSDHKNKRDLQSFVTKFLQKYSFNYKKSDQDLKKLYEDLYLKFVA